MRNKIKEYLDYQKNKRIAKRELARMLSAFLPSMRKLAESKAITLDTIHRTALAAKDMKGSELVRLAIDSAADLFAINHEKFMETGAYLMNLSPEEIQKILIHSMVETEDSRKNLSNL